MKINWLLIKNTMLAGFTIFLVSFTNKRFDIRKPEHINLVFEGESTLFMTDSMVNKLLIQKNRNILSFSYSEVDLNGIEHRLKNNPYVRDAQVYLTINKTLEVSVTQKTPIARVSADRPFYLDEAGDKMPLSPHFSARVILIDGMIDKKNEASVYAIVREINNDPFLKQIFIGIRCLENKRFLLIPRKFDYKVYFGNAVDIKQKLKNYKTFFQYSEMKNLHNQYDKINLQFKNQIVCTKKVKS